MEALWGLSSHHFQGQDFVLGSFARPCPAELWCHLAGVVLMSNIEPGDLFFVFVLCSFEDGRHPALSRCFPELLSLPRCERRRKLLACVQHSSHWSLLRWGRSQPLRRRS